MQNDAAYTDARKPENKTEPCIVTGEKIQEGGMSLLLETIDPNLLRGIAMKIMRDDQIKDEHELSRMVTETQITAQLDHPDIIIRRNPIYN